VPDLASPADLTLIGDKVVVTYSVAGIHSRMLVMERRAFDALFDCDTIHASQRR
jgi:hypothetical protein